jgi:tetratricopeptide (TPR) repeat protein
MKPGRNERCPCGSGRKYKQCCLRQASLEVEEPRAAEPVAAQSPTALDSQTISRMVGLAKESRYADMEIIAARITLAQPQAGLAWKALGVAQRMQGKDALTALERAAQLLPQDPESHSNLGAALRQTGRLSEAVACYSRALEILPDSAEIWNNLGNALRDLGRCAEAVAAFSRALLLKPGFAKAHNNLGNALQDLGKSDEAIASYRRALALDPGYAEAHLNLGSALRLLNRTAEAQASCQRALEIDPNYTAAFVLAAELHSDRGQFAEAESAYRRALEIEPDLPEAWAGFAGLKRMTVADSDWLKHAQRIAALPLAPRRELPLRHALGKYFDDVADHEQAFANYRRANELARSSRPPHDREAVTRGMDRLIRLYDEDWMRRPRPWANPSARPVFIVGMPRAGTTLAEQILAAHGAVFGAGELPFWNAAASRHAAAATGVAAATGGDGATLEADLLATLADEYLTLLASLSADASRVVDKMPGNFLYLGLLCAALPKARIIHLQRHPIDTCLSIYFQNFSAAHPYANDLDDLAHYYREYLRIMAHWRRTLPAGAMLEIGYEALVGDPETSSRRMLDFIGLPWDPSCLEFHADIRHVSTFSKWQARQPINTSSVARRRDYEPFLGALRGLDASD